MLNSLLVIQPIDLCNLDCSYCYLPGRRDPRVMSADVLEAIIRKSLNSTRVLGKQTTMVWHSGEPLLAQLDFYRKACQLIRRYKRTDLHIKQAIQTNATQLNDEWCRFFKEEQFSVSVSLDGPEHLHNAHRVDLAGNGSFDRVMAGVETLFLHGLPLRAICVVTRETLDYPDEVFEFFRSAGFSSLSFNIDEIEGSNAHSSFGRLAQADDLADVTRLFRRFLRRVYELWDLNGRPLWIREFDRTLDVLHHRGRIGGAPISNSEVVGLGIISFTRDGFISTYSPELSNSSGDFARNFSIANIADIDSLDDLISSQPLHILAREVNAGTLACARSCNYFDVCGGGSPSNKYFELGHMAGTETAYCRLQKQAVVDVVLEQLGVEQLC